MAEARWRPASQKIQEITGVKPETTTLTRHVKGSEHGDESRSPMKPPLICRRSDRFLLSRLGRSRTRRLVVKRNILLSLFCPRSGFTAALLGTTAPLKNDIQEGHERLRGHECSCARTRTRTRARTRAHTNVREPLNASLMES